MILVGRSHQCQLRQAVTNSPVTKHTVTKSPVTKSSVTKSRGRPPIGEKAMTGAERMRRMRARRAAAQQGEPRDKASGAPQG